MNRHVNKNVPVAMRIRENGILTGNMNQRKLAKNVKQNPRRFFAYLKNKKKSNKIVPFLRKAYYKYIKFYLSQEDC